MMAATPTVTMTAETKPLRMQRRDRELDIGALQCCSVLILGDGVFWHRAQSTSGVKVLDRRGARY